MWSSSSRFSFWVSKCIWIKYHWSLVRQVSHAVFAFSMWINTCNPSNKSTTFMSTFMCLCLQFKRGTAINWDKSENCTCDLNGSVFSQQYVPGFHVPGGREGERKKINNHKQLKRGNHAEQHWFFHPYGVPLAVWNSAQGAYRGSGPSSMWPWRAGISRNTIKPLIRPLLLYFKLARQLGFQLWNLAPSSCQ